MLPSRVTHLKRKVIDVYVGLGMCSLFGDWPPPRHLGRPVLPPGGRSASDPAEVRGAGGRARESGVCPDRRRSGAVLRRQYTCTGYLVVLARDGGDGSQHVLVLQQKKKKKKRFYRVGLSIVHFQIVDVITETHINKVRNKIDTIAAHTDPKSQ